MARRQLVVTGAFAAGICIGIVVAYIVFAAAPGVGGTASGTVVDQLQVRTEEYQPSCEALRRSGARPVVVRKGDDLYLTVSRDDYYYVIGIFLPPGRPPVFSWWGADLENALQECSQ